MTAFQSIFAGLFIMSASIISFISNLVRLAGVFSIRRNGVRTGGIVTDLVFDDEDSLSCGIRILFSTEEEKEYIIESSSGSAFWRNMKGRQVDVVYKRSDPSRAYIVKEQKGSGLVIFMINLVIVSTGAFFRCQRHDHADPGRVTAGVHYPFRKHTGTLLQVAAAH